MTLVISAPVRAWYGHVWVQWAILGLPPLAEAVDVKLGGGHPTLAAGGTNRRQHWAMGLDEGTRWRVVEAYHRTSSYARVAKDFGCHVATVRRWVKRYSQTNKVQHAPRSGRPSSGASSEAGKALLEQGLRQGKDCRELARDLDTYLGVRCSAESVGRVVVTLAQQRRPLSKPVLSERHKRDRLAFCQSWVDKNHEVLAFSDSKYFFFNQGGKGYKVWVLNGEEPPTLPAYSKCTKKVAARLCCGHQVRIERPLLHYRHYRPGGKPLHRWAWGELPGVYGSAGEVPDSGGHPSLSSIPAAQLDMATRWRQTPHRQGYYPKAGEHGRPQNGELASKEP